jgi:hypothetical protein
VLDAVTAGHVDFSAAGTVLVVLVASGMYR